MLHSLTTSIPISCATSLSTIYTITYVGVLYISPTTRPQAGLRRDNPTVIQSRICAVTIATLLCVIFSCFVVCVSTNSTWSDAGRVLGLWPITGTTVIDCVHAILLIMVLFCGPLFERLLYTQYSWTGTFNVLPADMCSWLGWRNYVVAPITEEIVFRACMIPLHVLAGCRPEKIVFFCPLYFGIAHIHHAYEFYLVNPRSIRITVIRSIIQFSYTTIFGWLATFLFIRYGSVWPAILVHGFCNYMGLPNLDLSGVSWQQKYLYYILLVGGGWGFYNYVWLLTDSTNSMLEF
ncbi:hypothetical protein EDC01DRAFT_657263 [Geopyxis carbonaria]|nr:hypothetical protein EDC01DRAFT_657263 [Geopyxis carbonaria]